MKIKPMKHFCIIYHKPLIHVIYQSLKIVLLETQYTLKRAIIDKIPLYVHMFHYKELMVHAQSLFTTTPFFVPGLKIAESTSCLQL